MTETKDSIIRVAREIFLKKGLDGLSMRSIAAGVGISATAIYRHFADKDAVLTALVDLSRQELNTSLIREYALAENQDPLRRLAIVGGCYVDFGLDHSKEYRIMFMSWDQLDEERHISTGNQQLSKAFSFFHSMVSDCLPDANREDVMAWSVFFWSHVHGLVSLYISGGGRRIMDKKTYRAFCRQQIEMSLSALP